MLFVITYWVLVYHRPPGRPIHKTMLGIAITMFVLATMVWRLLVSSAPDSPPSQHIGVNYTRIIKAFIILKNEPGGPAAFFNELSEFTQLFGSAIYVAQTLVGDSVVVRISASSTDTEFHSCGNLNSFCGAISCGAAGGRSSPFPSCSSWEAQVNGKKCVLPLNYSPAVL